MNIRIMDKIISIIIPTYNMEKYLERCLSSLLVDRKNDIEVLVVNDGSNDGSLQIAQKFANQYPDVFRVIDKSNGNYGSCVNAAMKVATGKYVKLLDADDAFDTANFNMMMGILMDTDADMILTDYVKNYGEGTKETISFSIPDNRIIGFDEITMNRDVRRVMMHAVTYRRENLLKIGYVQSEGIFYTDNEWIFRPLSTVKTVFYLHLPVYIYSLDREGQSVDPTVEQLHSMDNIKVSCAMLRASSLIRNSDISEPVKEFLNSRLYNRIRHQYKDYIVNGRFTDMKELDFLDDNVCDYDGGMYLDLNHELLSKPLFCLPYIYMWRMHPKSHLQRVVISTYNRYKRLKKKHS